jgi:hypothetical protein
MTRSSRYAVTLNAPCGTSRTLILDTPLPPLGDRNGHYLVNLAYSCVGVEGFLKDAVVTAFSVVEWDHLRQQSPLHWVFIVRRGEPQSVIWKAPGLSS